MDGNFCHDSFINFSYFLEHNNWRTFDCFLLFKILLFSVRLKLKHEFIISSSRIFIFVAAFLYLSKFVLSNSNNINVNCCVVSIEMKFLNSILIIIAQWWWWLPTNRHFIVLRSFVFTLSWDIMIPSAYILHWLLVLVSCFLYKCLNKGVVGLAIGPI